MWLVPMVCTQLQLNLRNATHHVPDYVTNYYRRRPVHGGFDSSHRPGTDTLIFSRTVTEIERGYGNFSIGSEGGQDGRHNSPSIVPTSAQGPERNTGKKGDTVHVPSVDLCTGMQQSPSTATTYIEIPSPDNLDSSSRADSTRNASGSHQRVEVQVECDHETGVSRVLGSSLETAIHR